MALRWVLIIVFCLLNVDVARSKEKKVEVEPAQETLLEAVIHRDSETVRKVLSKDKSGLEKTDERKRTPLLIATFNDDIETARLLIEAGADVNAQDDKLDSPLLYAGAEGRLQILKMILKAKPNFKIYNRYGGTALIPACERGHVEVVKELLKTDIDINHKNKLGWTALLEAVILGTGGQKHQEIVKLLVDAGADKTIADNEGVTALEHAKKRNLKEMVAILSR
ncbi:ankyrin repeat domain protein [Bdellovibrio bacteriovorus W]|nr:ankyrin repeat domain protein [Bdellovibrio bacteriovorus W]